MATRIFEPQSFIGPGATSQSGINRRSFLGRIGVGTAAAVAAAALSDPSVASAKESTSDRVSDRLQDAFELRKRLAYQDAEVPAARNVGNGDEELYPDKSGTYTKALPHDSFGRVDLNAFASFKRALNSGEFSDFENIAMGGTRTLNDPQSGLCFDLEALDNAQFGQPQVPPAPTTASDQNATELLEHYWASLLRDVAFTDYASNP